MKKILTYIFISTLTFLLGFGINSIHPDTIAKNKVLHLINELHTAYVYEDEEKIRLILADKIQNKVRNGNFETVSSDKFIEFIKEVDIEFISSGFYSTQVNEKQITVHFYMGVRFKSSDHDSFDHLGGYIYTFIKHGKNWKLTSIHSKNNL